MKVLLVHSGNAVLDSNHYTFVKQQGDALEMLGVKVYYYAVKGKGARGYLKSLSGLKIAIREFGVDLVHAHFGLCGALAVMQRKVPVVITFHNGETLTKKGKVLSTLAAWSCAYRIFVAQHIHDKLFKTPRHYAILPCGIDVENLLLIEKEVAISSMGLTKDRPNILFGGSFSNLRKNYPLARQAIERLSYPVNLIEMRGYDSQQVNLLYCACDMLLLPTKSEGSPQVVKEAMACNCPIIATAVADIPELLSGVDNCYVTGFDADEIANCIDKVLKKGSRSNGRQKVVSMGLDNPVVAQKLVAIYESVISKKNQNVKRKQY